MNIAEQIKAKLEEIKPVYDACQDLQSSLHDAETLEIAHKEYHNRMDEEEKRLDLPALRHLRAQREWDSAQIGQSRQEKDRDEPPPDLFRKHVHNEQSAVNTTEREPPPLPPAPPPSPDLQAIVKARREFRGIVRRLRRTWRFDVNLQGTINRIAEDKETPLGEALVLIDWKMFKEPVDRHETEAGHLDRLGKWGGALSEYHGWLDQRIRSLNSQYPKSHGICELWKDRGTDEGSRAWQSLLEKGIEERQAEAQSLRAEISRLEREIAASHELDGGQSASATM